jgi:hypothetical protein
MRIFFKSEIDERKLRLPWYELARQHPGRREHIHGPLHEMHCKCAACRKVAA